MRFSTLTLVVFVAHTSTQAVAAPLPLYDDLQDLVARAGDEASASSSGTSSNWKKVATSVAKAVPAPLLNLPIKSNFGSVVQKAVSAAAGGGSSQSHIRLPPMPQTPSSPALRKTNSVLETWNKQSGSAFSRPSQGGIAASPAHKALAEMQKAKAHPVTAVLERLKISKSSQASPTRNASPVRKASPAGKPVKALKPAKALKAHKVSSASHARKVGKASQARKVSQVRNAATAAKARKASHAKLRKRDLEIDELD